MHDTQTKQGYAATYFNNQSGQEVKVSIATFQDVMRLLQTLSMRNRETPFTGVYIHDDEGNSLAIGLADIGWLIIFGDAQRNHMAFSVGDPNALGDIGFLFYQYEEFPIRYILSVDKAVEVIQYWFETKKLSTSIQWLVEEF